MLVLSRKAGQKIQIGDDVFITVAAIKGNRIALGIEAPNEVAIRRGELLPMPAFESAAVDTADGMERQVA